MARQANFKLASIFLLTLLVTTATGAASLKSSTISPSETQVSPYEIKLFIPAPHSIHSDQINDAINGLHGDVLFATSFGLSDYNGTWETRHINRDNTSEGILNDFVTAVEYDEKGDLWIGYSGGLQIFNGQYYRTILDQQLLKDTQIRDIQRWNQDMWVATGNAGIHRYRDDSWTWFQPMTKSGPGFYEIDSMALDSKGDSLLIATYKEGLWIIKSPEDPVQFIMLQPYDGTFGLMQHVRRDPLGGVYFFNSTSVIHYSGSAGFEPVLTSSTLSFSAININDVAAAADGRLYLATDDGIYIWQEGTVTRHLTRFEGIGTSQIVNTVFADAENRAWFATQGYVGYYRETSPDHSQIPVVMVTPNGPGNLSWTIVPKETPVFTTNTTIEPSRTQQPGFFSPITDPLAQVINKITSYFGFRAFP